MPTIFSHPAVPLALAVAIGTPHIRPRLLIAGTVASIVPDLDVLAFRLGIGYAHEFGHRGMSHSLLFALFLGLIACAAARWLQASRSAALFFVSAAAASHGLLDMLTNGGLGVALLWPYSDERFFFPQTPIEASPLSLRRVFGSAGLAVLGSELLWVWLPCATLGIAGLVARRKNAP